MKIYCAFGVNENKAKQSQTKSIFKSEDRRQKTEDGRQKTEDRRRKTDDGKQKAEYGPSGLVPAKRDPLAMTARNMKYRIMKEN